MLSKPHDQCGDAMALPQLRALFRTFDEALVAQLRSNGTLHVEHPAEAGSALARVNLAGPGFLRLGEWPFAVDRSGETIPMQALRARLNELQDHLVAELGADGKLHIAHPTAPLLIVATLDLTVSTPYGPRLEQLEAGPALIRDEVTSAWDVFEFIVGPTAAGPSAARGPFLLTHLDETHVVDVYGDAPPWEDNAVATRQLTLHDVDGGCWYVDHGEVIFSERAVRIRGRRRP